MKILHIVHGYPPSIGGSQWLIKNLSEQLVSRHGDQVTVFTTTAYNMELFWRTDEAAMPAGTEEMNGVIVRRFPVFNHLGKIRMLLAHGAHRLRLPYNDWLRTIYNGPLIPNMTRAIAKNGADVAFAMAFPHLHMYYALSGARRAGIPIVLMGAIHAADRWGYDRKMMYRAIRRADAYVALTTYERDHLIQHGIRAEKISVIGAGVDANAFVDADGTETREQYGWGDAPVVALIAKQTYRKRFDVLLEAMQRVWAVRPESRLLLAGAHTAYSHQIRQIISHFPPEQQAHITLLDGFAEGAKPSLLAACDVFVSPSGHESFGITFVEAWACGKPVIGVRVGAIPSVIAEGSDGLLVPYDDPYALAEAILELLSNPRLRAGMGQAGRQKVIDNYTWCTVADRVRDVYTTAIARHTEYRQT